ncbi:MAG: helix-turn-helix transcriptional regulator [Marinicaulis sp.]|nr:helix-turn-helix transcriptional regulator [Marinicaulis sp.]NNL87700.1 helix-turn-helix transcriptional regulator [Marinicaulis sp.]
MRKAQSNFVDEIDMRVGAALKRIRKQNKYELEYVSAVSGVSVEEIVFLESGLTNFSASTLYRIAKALKTPINALFDDVTAANENA